MGPLSSPLGKDSNGTYHLTDVFLLLKTLIGWQALTGWLGWTDRHELTSPWLLLLIPLLDKARLIISFFFSDNLLGILIQCGYFCDNLRKRNLNSSFCRYHFVSIYFTCTEGTKYRLVEKGRMDNWATLKA